MDMKKFSLGTVAAGVTLLVIWLPIWLPIWAYGIFDGFPAFGLAALAVGGLLTLVLGWKGVATPMEGAAAGGVIGLLMGLAVAWIGVGVGGGSLIFNPIVGLAGLIGTVGFGIIGAVVAKVIGGAFRSDAPKQQPTGE